MDKPHHHIVLIGILCLATVAYCAEMSQSKVELKRTVMCLLENVTKEIHLSCGEDAAIHVKSVLQGYQEIPQDTPFCSYQEEDDCGVRDPELYDTMVERCMGAADCLVPVKRIVLNPCGKTSDYVQAEYECIPKNTPKENIIDVCGDILGGESIVMESGYIQTPNYPTLYPPDESCMCSLKALQNETQIKITILDIDVQSVNKTTCIGDWLEYATPGVMWGQGVRMCNATNLNKTHTIGSNLELHFRADSMNESRGFWIKYEGLGKASQPVPIRIQCSQYHPSINMEKGQCLSAGNNNELFLSCKNSGVIEVTGMEHWTKNDDTTCPLLTAASQDSCYEQIDDHPVLRSCMGQPMCNVPISSQHIPKCQAESNFFEVQYKCIVDADEVHNIVDICGDSMKGEVIHRKSGFIETPDYPHDYPPNVNCQCRLSTTEPQTTIQLRVIDMVITGDANKMCMDDWLEYDTDPMNWNRGIKICDGLKEEQVLDTNKSDIYLNFNSDGLNENRGFWIQYSARRLPENTEVPVKVTCNEWQGKGKTQITDGSDPSMKKSSDPGDSSNNNIPLIVGLTVVIVPMLILCSGMVLYKVKDSRKKYPPMQSTALDTPLDKSFNSLKRYSTLNEEGGPAEHGHRNKGGRFQMRHDEYQRTAVAASQLNLPSSYINPVFEGSPVV